MDLSFDFPFRIHLPLSHLGLDFVHENEIVANSASIKFEIFFGQKEF